jgi:hypothetical protein
MQIKFSAEATGDAGPIGRAQARIRRRIENAGEAAPAAPDGWHLQGERWPDLEILARMDDAPRAWWGWARNRR